MWHVHSCIVHEYQWCTFLNCICSCRQASSTWMHTSHHLIQSGSVVSTGFVLVTNRLSYNGWGKASSLGYINVEMFLEVWQAQSWSVSQCFLQVFKGLSFGPCPTPISLKACHYTSPSAVSQSPSSRKSNSYNILYTQERNDIRPLMFTGLGVVRIVSILFFFDRVFWCWEISSPITLGFHSCSFSFETSCPRFYCQFLFNRWRVSIFADFWSCRTDQKVINTLNHSASSRECYIS